MPYELGDRIDELALVRPDGTPFALAELTSPAVLLVFLRHLA
jgi:hypothetical protein